MCKCNVGGWAGRGDGSARAARDRVVGGGRREKVEESVYSVITDMG